MKQLVIFLAISILCLSCGQEKKQLKNGKRYLVKFQENSMNVFIFGMI